MPTKREFLMLAHTYDEEKHGDSVIGWYMSEKLDGIRAFWDGGISRGIITFEVPWANTLKDSRLKRIPVATGLWTRRGKVIHAPKWFLDQLPPFPLDGELLDGYSRQSTQSIISKHSPSDNEWAKILYFIFESPPLSKVFEPGFYRASASEVVEIEEHVKDFVNSQLERSKGLALSHLTWSFKTKHFN